MNLIDLVVLAFVGLGAANGVRQGASTLICSYGGFFIGLLIGWWFGTLVAHSIASNMNSQILKLLIGMAIIFIPALLIGSVGHFLGTKLHFWMREHSLHSIDAGSGVIVAVVATLIVVWFLGDILANSPSQNLNSQIQRSTVIRALNQTLPQIPLNGIRQLVTESGIPSVFSQFAPLPPGSVQIASATQVNQDVAQVGKSVVKIIATGCGQIQEGSGFVASNGVVVTNAHVVAGTANIKVQDSLGIYGAQVIYFDPIYDLAILNVNGLNDPPLSLDTSTLAPATKTVLIGYPGGGPFNSQPSGILQEFNAIGPDIYGQGSNTRPVYQIQGLVRPGNSGGPLLTLNGQVAGVVFSGSTTDANVGYALLSSGVKTRLQSALANPQTVSTGGCVS